MTTHWAICNLLCDETAIILASEPEKFFNSLSNKLLTRRLIAFI